MTTTFPQRPSFTHVPNEPGWWLMCLPDAFRNEWRLITQAWVDENEALGVYRVSMNRMAFAMSLPFGARFFGPIVVPVYEVEEALRR